MSLSAGSRGRRGLLSDVLTFDRLVTGPIVHVIYWCGLCLILLFGFAWVGGSVGLALRAMSLEILLVAIPAVVVGLLIMAALALLWRGMCEFYVAVFRIAEDLHALRLSTERETVNAAVRGATDRRLEL
ncbi:MAG: DUF4282 domain-containing protein [Caulobacteraceae bacterium]